MNPKVHRLDWRQQLDSILEVRGLILSLLAVNKKSFSPDSNYKGKKQVWMKLILCMLEHRGRKNLDPR